MQRQMPENQTGGSNGVILCGNMRSGTGG